MGRAELAGHRGGAADQRTAAPASANSLQRAGIGANRAWEEVPYLGTTLEGA
jgi:hypothetical protein